MWSSCFISRTFGKLDVQSRFFDGATWLRAPDGHPFTHKPSKEEASRLRGRSRPSQHALPMSRKAKAVAQAKSAGTFASPGCIVASHGYSQVKPQQLPAEIAIVLWLPEADEEPRVLPLQERVGHLLPAVQQVLMAADGGASPPRVIFLVDCTPLIPSGSTPRAVVDAEGAATGPLGKHLGKPVGRLLEKILVGHRGRASLVAFEGGAQLALRLLQAASNDHGLKEGVLSRLVLLRPRLSAASVNTLLAKQLGTKLVVDVYYESAAALEKRDVMVRHAYAHGTSCVLAPNRAHSHGGGLYVSLLSNDGDATGSTWAAEAHSAQVDPEGADSVGQSVFWSELTFEMSRQTKMLDAVLMDLDPYEIAQAALAASAQAPPVPQAPSAPSTDAGPTPLVVPSTTNGGMIRDHGLVAASWVGALVLRGNRCVLVRSLASPPDWSGMRIPFVKLGEGESAPDGAVRAASEYCDIDGQAEVELLRHIPPVTLYMDVNGPQHEQRCVLVYALYAVQPPPDGPLEDADLTDDDDIYDWYTWPRAVHVLRKEPRSLSTLRTLACALAAAADADHLPQKWGGVFGQEWLGASTEPAPVPTAVPEVLPGAPRSMAEKKAPARAAAATAALTPSSEEALAFSKPPQGQADTASRLALLEAKVDQIIASMARGTAVPSPTPHEAAATEAATEVVPLTVVDGPLSVVKEATNLIRDTNDECDSKLLGVTVLSGFLGSGKTTLLNHLLNNRLGYRIAVVVNDMASVNIDAELVRRGSVLQQEDKMIELSNGCICCTLREDLLTSLSALASEQRFDHVLIESSGISEPMPVAETFTFRDEASGVSLGDVAALHNLVTVVDAASIFDQLGTVDKLADRGWQAGYGDERTVANLLCDQVHA